jgi:hypothetical protein
MKFLAVTLFSVLCLSAWGADHGGSDRGGSDRGGDRNHHSSPSFHGYPRPSYPVYPVYPVRPVYPVGNYYISGYYETRTETILVQPERIESQYIEPVYDTRYTADGRPVVVKVADGYYRNTVIPAKYVTREVRVWTPGYWSGSPLRTYPPVVVEPRSGVDFNFSIGQRGNHTSWGLNLGIRE